jgi:hypothetical protein
MGKMKDLAIQEANAERSSRGKRARQRGNSFEREVGLSYPERLDKWLRELNPKADQLAVLVVGDSPGAGKRRRALAIIDFDDFVQHYGKEETSEL